VTCENDRRQDWSWKSRELHLHRLQQDVSRIFSTGSALFPCFHLRLGRHNVRDVFQPCTCYPNRYKTATNCEVPLCFTFYILLCFHLLVLPFCSTFGAHSWLYHYKDNKQRDCSLNRRLDRDAASSYSSSERGIIENSRFFHIHTVHLDIIKVFLFINWCTS
jgi:hypothetical protein